MTVKELSRDQMTELKQHYLTQHLLECEDREPTWGELAAADDIVADWLIFDAYGGISFVENDFSSDCSSTEEFTKENLWELRKEIVLCSYFIADYQNSMGFKPEPLFNFFDGYAEELEMQMEEKEVGFKDENFFDLLGKYDNADNLWDYYSDMDKELKESLFIKEA